MDTKIISSAILGTCLVVGLGSFGSSVESGMESQRVNTRTISVVGKAEKEVLADKVTFPITFMVYGEDLVAEAKKLSEQEKVILNFLKGFGLEEKEIIIGQPKVVYTEKEARNAPNAMRSAGLESSDKLLLSAGAIPQNSAPEMEKEEVAQEKGDKGTKKAEPFSITKNIIISTDKVELIPSITAKMGSLMEQGISLSDQYAYAPIEYSFNGLEEAQEKLSIEATEKAVKDAQNMAKASDSKLGKVKNISQGQIFISSDDRYAPQIKKIRVENRLEFYLK